MRPNWFVGVPVPAGGWFPACLGAPPPRVRPFHPDDLHLTVAFLGPVDEAAARAAFALAPRWSLGALDVTFGRVTLLGDPRAPSAVSALVDGGREALAAAIGAARDAMREAAGLGPERRAPLPHCTLARVARRADAEERALARRWAEALPVAGVAVGVGGLALYTWAEDRRARQFQVVARLDPR